MQAAPKLADTNDYALYSDTLSTAPRAQIQNSGAAMTLNIPRAVLFHAAVPTPSVGRICFFQQNASVSAATVAVAAYVGTDPTALTLWGSSTVPVSASLADIYYVWLNSQGPVPAGYVLLVAQATAVGATVPSLSVCGQASANTFVSIGPFIWTNLVGAATMTPWPTQTSVAISNSAVWTGSALPIWLALGN